MLKEYVQRPTHLMTEVNDAQMVFEDGTNGPFGQFKSFYDYDATHYLIHESASCCPNSNVVIVEKDALNGFFIQPWIPKEMLTARCKLEHIEQVYDQENLREIEPSYLKITDNIQKQSITIEVNTTIEFIEKTN